MIMMIMMVMMIMMIVDGYNHHIINKRNSISVSDSIRDHIGVRINGNRNRNIYTRSHHNIDGSSITCSNSSNNNKVNTGSKLIISIVMSLISLLSPVLLQPSFSYAGIIIINIIIINITIILIDNLKQYTDEVVSFQYSDDFSLTPKVSTISILSLS